MQKSKISRREALKYLAKMVRIYPDITGEFFDGLFDKPCTERVYRRMFGTWEKAKFLACRYQSVKKVIVQGKLADTVKSTSDHIPKPLTPQFNVEEERSRQIIAELKLEVKHLKQKAISTEDVRKFIFKLVDKKPDYPQWLLDRRLGKGSMHGVPILLLSDFHSGEIIKKDQVFGVNEFNGEIEDKRVQMLAANMIDICTVHLPSKYPGLVILLNGDFVSGDIHDELTITNEKPIMPVVLAEFGRLVWFIDEMSKYFPKLALFCCPGNHSRTTKKSVFKDKALTTYDWLIYSLLEKHFENNPNIHFEITPGDDIQFRVYNHIYRMTHGAQFRGGQGFLGHIAPVTRGEIRKRSAAESYDRLYDTLVLGHFHSYGWFRRAIINGSLVGYSEFSFGSNFNYERPQQALWINHPEHGITFRVPIFCTKEEKPKPIPWVTWEGKNNE